MLGNIYKVNSSSQLNTIAPWSKDGGFLIMSCPLFTGRLKPSKEGQKGTNKWLLEDPNLVVANEAHTMKSSLVQFKAKYVDPIIEGLHTDSDASERRLSLRKLHVLKRDLDPKINRADVTAIEADLPSKIEYSITIHMTGLQEQAYNMVEVE